MVNDEQAEVIIPLNGPPRDISPKLTVVEQVYHRVGDENPTHIDTRYSRTLATDEQVYERRLTVRQE